MTRRGSFMPLDHGALDEWWRDCFARSVHHEHFFPFIFFMSITKQLVEEPEISTMSITNFVNTGLKPFENTIQDLIAVLEFGTSCHVWSYGQTILQTGFPFDELETFPCPSKLKRCTVQGFGPMISSPCWLRGQFCQGVRGVMECEGMWRTCLHWFARTVPDTLGVIFTLFAGNSLVACPLFQNHGCCIKNVIGINIAVLHLFPEPGGLPIVIYKFLKPLCSIIIISGSHVVPTPSQTSPQFGFELARCTHACMHKRIHCYNIQVE